MGVAYRRANTKDQREERFRGMFSEWNGCKNTALLINGLSQPGVFPATFMGDLLVSKQYVDEAIRVWAQTKTFYFNRYYDVDPVLDSGSAIERHLLRHIRSFVISDGELILPKPAIVMSSLQYVTMPFNEMLFHCDIDKSIWHDNFTDLELVQDCQIAALLKFRGLRSLTVNWGRPIETSKPEEKAHGEKFQLQVQSLVDDVVLQPREKMGATTSPWNFQHALTEAKKARNSGRSSMMKPADQAGQNATPLRDNEVPGTENELLRLFLTRPRAMMAWHKDAKKAKAKVPKLEQELAAYSGDVGLDFS